MERKQPKCVEIGPGPCLVCADAQATIAALQARVRELESQHEDLAQRNRILRHRPDLPIERTEFHDQFAALQSQLTQRTAELEAAKRERDEILQAHTKEPIHEPVTYQALAGARAVARMAFNELVKTSTRYSDLQAELERVRGAH